MSYRIESDESVEDAVQRIASEQIDKAIDEIDDSDLDDEETIHQVRKRCKKIRGLLRLVRTSFEENYSAENKSFRDLARGLSELRDHTSRIECLERLKKQVDGDVEPHLESVRALLVDERDAHYDRTDVPNRLERFKDGMEDAKRRLKDWRLADEDFDAVGGGLRKTYRRARNAMRRVHDDPSVEAFHEWRKRVKYHRYHVRLLVPLWEPVLEVRREALHELSDVLGDAHDLAILRQWLLDRGGHMKSAIVAQRTVGLADGERMELRARALPLGRRLFADKPSTLAKRTRAYWESRQTEVELLSEGS